MSPVARERLYRYVLFEVLLPLTTGGGIVRRLGVAAYSIRYTSGVDQDDLVAWFEANRPGLETVASLGGK